MKRFLITLLALLLVFSTLLVSCGPKGDEAPETPPADDSGNPPAPEGTGYTVTQSYLPAAVSSQMRTFFEGSDKSFAAHSADRASAPFVMVDGTLTDCTLKSITIPVMFTGDADAGNCFIFTLSVVSLDLNGLNATLADPIQEIPIEISATTYELQENKTIRKFIKVPLSQYNITLGKNETLAFGAPDDTLHAAIVKTDTVDENDQKFPAAKYFIDNWGVLCYYFRDAENDGAFTISQSSLLFDVEYERTYESEAAYQSIVSAKAAEESAYQSKLAAVKTAYQGKYISMMGDSISTCGGVTNNTEYNATIGSNAVYGPHQPTANSYHYSKIYWGRVATDTGMHLDVMNAWSGGRVYGKPDNYNDNMLKRSYQLANTQGVNPDVVLLYYGINDINSSPSSIYASGDKSSVSLPTGDLYQRLTNKGNKTTNEVVAQWFSEVQTKASNAGYVRTAANPVITPGTTYVCWEAAYALALYNILNSYNGPEVYIMTLIETNHSSAADGKLDRANTILRAFAEYFGTGLIDQQKGYLNQSICHLYTYDTSGLHPNLKGHELMARLIVETMYDRLSK